MLSQPVDRFIMREFKGFHCIPVLVAFITNKAHGIGIVGHTKVVISLSATTGYLFSSCIIEFNPEIGFIDMQTELVGL